MTRDILAIPITTVAPEATFNVRTRALNPYHSSLSADIIQILMCDGDWGRNLYGIKKSESEFYFTYMMIF